MLTGWLRQLEVKALGMAHYVITMHDSLLLAQLCDAAKDNGWYVVSVWTESDQVKVLFRWTR